MQRSNRAAGTQHRQALAAAVANLKSAERDLQAAVDAKNAALERQSDAEDRLEALRNSDEQGADLGAVFTQSVRSGAPADLATLERPAVKRQEAIARAQHDVDIWSRTLESCRSAVPARQSAVAMAKVRAEAAAADAVRRGDAVEQILDGLEDLQRQVFERRLALHFLERRDLVAEVHKDTVRAVLSKTMPTRAAVESRIEWEGHPVFRSWSDAFEALKRDAGAPLPIAGSKK